MLLLIPINLTINGITVRLYCLKTIAYNIEKSPVAIFKTDTLASASDGGFYKYTGTWKDEEAFEIIAIETDCDYCPELVEEVSDGKYKRVFRKQIYKGRKSEKTLILNGITFR